MKAGQVYKYFCRQDDSLYYVVVMDYGTLRPLMLGNLEMNCTKECGLKSRDAEEKNGFYQGDVLVAGTLNEFMRKKFTQ